MKALHSDSPEKGESKERDERRREKKPSFNEENKSHYIAGAIAFLTVSQTESPNYPPANEHIIE